MQRIRKIRLPFDDDNMVAGVNVYKEHCAVCHGAPERPRTAMSKGMFPPPPQLLEKADMMTDDPEGETYWKVTHGIRLSGMPGFASTLSDTATLAGDDVGEARRQHSTSGTGGVQPLDHVFGVFKPSVWRMWEGNALGTARCLLGLFQRLAQFGPFALQSRKAAPLLFQQR